MENEKQLVKKEYSLLEDEQTYIKEIKNAINASGINISNYEVIRETSKGTLVLAKVRPYDNKKAFLFKDGKLKTAATATLCAIIKEL